MHRWHQHRLFQLMRERQRHAGEHQTAQAGTAALADDLRTATIVQLADTSWLSRDDLKRELDRVLAAFAAAGGRVMR